MDPENQPLTAEWRQWQISQDSRNYALIIFNTTNRTLFYSIYSRRVTSTVEYFSDRGGGQESLSEFVRHEAANGDNDRHHKVGEGRQDTTLSWGKTKRKKTNVTSKENTSTKLT